MSDGPRADVSGFFQLPQDSVYRGLRQPCSFGNLHRGNRPLRPGDLFENHQAAQYGRYVLGSVVCHSSNRLKSCCERKIKARILANKAPSSAPDSAKGNPGYKNDNRRIEISMPGVRPYQAGPKEMHHTYPPDITLGSQSTSCGKINSRIRPTS